MAASASIRQLPPDVIAQIKSSFTITSLNGVVLELVKNALDAQAQNIHISVEYSRGSCAVEDDGLGIPPSEFQEGSGLTKLYNTSKLEATSNIHGRRGAFLASVAALSLLSITSHHHLYHSHNTITLNNSKIISRQTPALNFNKLNSSNHGTRVIIRDLFGNMPVRVKQRSLEAGSMSNKKDWDGLCKDVAGLLLAWHGLASAKLIDSNSGRTIRIRSTYSAQQAGIIADDGLNTASICNLLHTSNLLYSPDCSSWVAMNASTSKMTIKGAISLEPSPTKGVQFISLGISPLTSQSGHSLFYEEINRLFAKSSFGLREELSTTNESDLRNGTGDERHKSEGFRGNVFRGSGKGVDKWPMFYIRIDLLDVNDSHLKQKIGEDLLDNDSSTLRQISDLLQAMILEFLKSYSFRPKTQSTAVSFQHKQQSGTIKSLVQTSNVTSAGLTSIADKFAITSGRHQMAPFSDDLGIRVKLPSFKQTIPQSTQSPFRSWSRVKAGRIVPLLQTFNGSLKTSLNEKGDSASPRNSIETNQGRRDPPQPTENYEGATQTREGKNGSASPLIHPRTGKLSRAPFSDHKEPPLDTAPVEATAESETNSDSDNYIKWSNPATKMTSLINSRTGLAIPPIQTACSNGTTPDSSSYTRRLSLGNSLPQSSHREPSDWMKDVLCNWKNPIFPSVEGQVPRLSLEGLNLKTQDVLHGHRHNCSKLDIEKAFQKTSNGFAGRLSKEALCRAEVVAQVDKKFILIKLASESHLRQRGSDNYLGEQLVLVDQHAADERCRVEDLMSELCTRPGIDPDTHADNSALSGVLSTVLDKPISFEVSNLEARLLRSHRQHFADWGILYDVHAGDSVIPQQDDKLVVRSLPPGIIEKCRMAPKLLIELIRTEVWKFNEIGTPQFVSEPDYPKVTNSFINDRHFWLKIVYKCPRGILDMLSSRSCRSAVMFNDELTIDQCKTILSRLAECAFPFQCAHGRPSMIPLVDLGALKEQEVATSSFGWKETESFGMSFKKWKATID